MMSGSCRRGRRRRRASTRRRYIWLTLGGACRPPSPVPSTVRGNDDDDRHHVGPKRSMPSITLNLETILGEGVHRVPSPRKILNKISWGQKAHAQQHQDEPPPSYPQRLCLLSPTQRPPRPRIIEPSLPMGVWAMMVSVFCIFVESQRDR